MATCPECLAHYPDDVDKCAEDGATLLPDDACKNLDEELESGTVAGDYRVDRKIGAGAFGIVYAATHAVIGKRAAIKVLNRQYSSNAAVVARFVAEARAVNQIHHKNIIDIFAFGVLDDGRQYFVMELLEGVTFDKYIAQHGRLSPEVALPILVAIGRALDTAHAAGIVHRDLKPDNVFLCFDDDDRPVPKLLDFGIAKLLGTEPRAHQTKSGAMVGTPRYMSPEQCRGKKSVDHRTDIYAFGVMTHEVLTGKPPFSAESAMDMMFKHAKEPPPAMSASCPAIPPRLDAPVLRMLAKDPAGRPTSLAEATGELVSAATEAGFEVTVKALSSRPRRTTGASGLGLDSDASSAEAATRQTMGAVETLAGSGSASSRLVIIAAATVVAAIAVTAFFIGSTSGPASGPSVEPTGPTGQATAPAPASPAAPAVATAASGTAPEPKVAPSSSAAAASSSATAPTRPASSASRPPKPVKPAPSPSVPSDLATPF
jgi:serine/threonine-protein kinase